MSLVPIFIAFCITQKTELEGRGLELGSQFEGVVVHHGMENTAQRQRQRLLAHILVGQEAAWPEAEPGHNPQCLSPSGPLPPPDRIF